MAGLSERELTQLVRVLTKFRKAADDFE